MQQKACKECGRLKPLTEFHRCPTVKDGRKARCAECVNAASRKWRIENPDKQAAATLAWRERNGDRVAKVKAEWTRNNADKVRAGRVRNADSRRAALARWKAQNRDRVREYQRRRRASATSEAERLLDTESLWSECGGRCGICRQSIDRSLAWPDPASASIDHIVPLSKGGAHVQENVQWAHLLCNLRKGDRPSEPTALAAGNQLPGGENQ